MSEEQHFLKSLTIPTRSTKPRDHGITMLLDYAYMANKALDDLLESESAFLDVAKFLHLNLSRPSSYMEKRIEIFRKHNIDCQTGGMLLELAYLQNNVAAFLDEIKALGFNSVEVSDSVASINVDQKKALLEQCLNAGVSVRAEVGKKWNMSSDKSRSGGRTVFVEETIDQMQQLLDAGASKIYWEGHILEELLGGSVEQMLGSSPEWEDKAWSPPERVEQQILTIANEIGHEKIVFEIFGMPWEIRRFHWGWLVNKFGADVNIGNVLIEDVQYVESIRRDMWWPNNYPYFRSLEGQEKGSVEPAVADD
jgi:phosphosulfolactate synthase (CoM biosynthesis protein A)